LLYQLHIRALVYIHLNSVWILAQQAYLENLIRELKHLAING